MVPQDKKEIRFIVSITFEICISKYCIETIFIIYKIETFFSRFGDPKMRSVDAKACSPKVNFKIFECYISVVFEIISQYTF